MLTNLDKAYPFAAEKIVPHDTDYHVTTREHPAENGDYLVLAYVVRIKMYMSGHSELMYLERAAYKDGIWTLPRCHKAMIELSQENGYTNTITRGEYTEIFSIPAWSAVDEETLRRETGRIVTDNESRKH